MIRYVSWAITALLALTLAACGFHLTGLNPDTMRPYPFTSLYIDSTQPIAAEVAARLRLDPRVKLTTSANSADAVLRILAEKKTRDIQTIDRSGQANEYRFTYEVSAQLLMHGEPIGRNMVLKQFRTMTYADSAILGKDQEEALLWSDMLRNTAQLLLYRMSSNNMAREVASAAAAAAAPQPKAQHAGSQP